MYICCFSAQNSWKLFAKDSHACAVLRFQSSLADMFPLVNTGVEGMTYLSSKWLMVDGGGCQGGTTVVLRGLELCWVGGCLICPELR